LPQDELFGKFPLMEVQQTFYKLPQRKTVQKWRQKAPGDFEFTLKAFQAITHPGGSPTYRRARLTPEERRTCGNFRDTPFVRQAWEMTLALASDLEATIVVFQCPPQFTASETNVAQLRWFFEWAERRGLAFAWEPRHASWTDELVCELCRRLDVIHVVDPLERPSVWGRLRYFRLHGRALGSFRYEYRHQYSDIELDLLRDRCLEGPTYCLFNNAKMAEDIGRFEALLRR
jgi:uncharacterized protein YecE (DUF72 family)